MPPLKSFDDVDGKERGQKKTDDLRAMTTLGPRTLHNSRVLVNEEHPFSPFPGPFAARIHKHQTLRMQRSVLFNL